MPPVSHTVDRVSVLVPEWMTLPEAAKIDIEDHPRLLGEIRKNTFPTEGFAAVGKGRRYRTYPITKPPST